MNSDDVFLVIISLLLVFAVLAGISLFVSFISFMIRGTSKKDKKEKVRVIATPSAEPTTDVVKSTAANGDDPAVVAAIIAAITAYRARQYGASNANRFRVVSFKRTSGR